MIILLAYSSLRNKYVSFVRLASRFTQFNLPDKQKHVNVNVFTELGILELSITLCY